MKRTTFILGCLLVLIIASLAVSQAVIAQTGGDYDLSWNTFTSGGVTVDGIGDPVYRIDSAIGQPFAGKTSASQYELCAGYLCGVPVETRVYLPLVRK